MPARQCDIINKLGLHARAAAKLVKLAGGFSAESTLRKDEQCVSAKSIMGVMMLAATQGSSLYVECTGSDADEALQAIADLIARRFDEDE